MRYVKVFVNVVAMAWHPWRVNVWADRWEWTPWAWDAQRLCRRGQWGILEVLRFVD